MLADFNNSNHTNAMTTETTTAQDATEKLLNNPPRTARLRKKLAFLRAKVPPPPDTSPVTLEAYLAPRLPGLKMSQLIQRRKRCIARRLLAQKAWEQLQDVSFPDKANFLRALEEKAAKLDILADAYAAEIERRTNKTKNQSK